MATPNLLPGNRFRIYRKDDTGTGYTFVCTANAVALTRTNEFEDATLPDCATPTSIPARQSIVRSTQWGVRFSGPYDPKLNSTVRTDIENQALNQTPTTYQILIDRPLASGGGTYTGALWFESVEEGKTNNGMVTYTVTARGEGPLVWADAAS